MARPSRQPRPTLTADASARARLLVATLRVIADEGLEAVTHRRVAALAGVSPGSTTQHFAPREDLLREAFPRPAAGAGRVRAAGSGACSPGWSAADRERRPVDRAARCTAARQRHVVVRPRPMQRAVARFMSLHGSPRRCQASSSTVT